MIEKFISGAYTLREIELTIANYEFGLVQSIKSKPVTQDNEKGNAVSFEPTGAVILGDLKLQLADDAPPRGYVSIWQALMVVENQNFDIMAWRHNSLNLLSTLSIEQNVAISHQENKATKEKEREPSHESIIQDSVLRYGVHQKTHLTDAGSIINFSKSPHSSKNNKPLLLVIHYTATTKLRPVVNWFAEPRSKVSAHLIIDRNGSVIQMVRFDRRAWHAGVSSWGNLININRFSIGIELVNAGKLRKTSKGWVAWNGAIIAGEEVTEATHVLDDKPNGWHEYTPQQLETLWQVGAALNQVFDFQDVVGHDSIAPNRKRDPGPLFPLDSIRAKILGRN